MPVNATIERPPQASSHLGAAEASALHGNGAAVVGIPARPSPAPTNRPRARSLRQQAEHTVPTWDDEDFNWAEEAATEACELADIPRDPIHHSPALAGPRFYAASARRRQALTRTEPYVVDRWDELDFKWAEEVGRRAGEDGGGGRGEEISRGP